MPKYRPNKLQRSLKCQGVKIWSDLPLDNYAEFTQNAIQTKVEITFPTILRQHEK